MAHTLLIRRHSIPPRARTIGLDRMLPGAGGYASKKIQPIGAAIARKFSCYLSDPPTHRIIGCRLGFQKRTSRDGGSDRLIDAVIAWGDVRTTVLSTSPGTSTPAGADQCASGAHVHSKTFPDTRTSRTGFSHPCPNRICPTRNCISLVVGSSCLRLVPQPVHSAKPTIQSE